MDYSVCEISASLLYMSWFHLSPECGRECPSDINATQVCPIYFDVVSVVPLLKLELCAVWVVVF